MSYMNLEKRRETQLKWREKNREKLRAYYKEKYGAEYKKKWRDEKPGQREQERRSRKNYYERNKEKEQGYAREYMRGWHEKNKDKRKVYLREKYLKDKRWFKEYLSQQKCSHCGLNNPDCLDFHHVNFGPNGNKEQSVAQMLCYSKKRIFAEIEKCIVLCANCHRKKHAKFRREQR